MQTYFCLYACCIPVKGFKRSTICDVQRDSYILIPNALYDILTVEAKSMSVESLIEYFGDEKLRSWLDLIVENDYGFYTQDESELLNLRPLDLDYKEPLLITNAIIDIDTFSNHDLKSIFNELSALLCEAIEIRIFYAASIETIQEILNYTKNTSFRSIQLLTAYNTDLENNFIDDLFEAHFRLNKLTLHSYSKNLIKEIIGNRMLIYTDEIINSEVHCGVVSSGLFSSNIFLFTEGLKNNNCLNRKISIDKQGNIKNCPSLVKSYGQVGAKKLSEIATTREFQELWSITKDMVDVCKDCEFRLMCQDCRAYLKDPENKYAKPLKCNYDPYEATWN
jgi:SPASM domain peptide maturase of grasp-with-spasm system